MIRWTFPSIYQHEAWSQYFGLNFHSLKDNVLIKDMSARKQDLINM